MRVHSLTLSYIPRSMRCDSWASFLAHTLANPCFGRKPEARVATNSGFMMSKMINKTTKRSTSNNLSNIIMDKYQIQHYVIKYHEMETLYESNKQGVEHKTTITSQKAHGNLQA
jgi:hypothetical protein